MKDSHRTPGYSYRRSGITHLKATVEENMAKHEVHGDALNGVPDRRPDRDDADRAGETPKKTPLM
ncbi:hypothetical protein JZ785_04920 [Alicyclobacillus curvatus]|nr:hypothetical protein JZ785_04920 [Alicyclobacillus curvatus]